MNQELDRFISENYQELVRYARKFSSAPEDLVHHTYLKARKANFVFINDPMTDYYLKRSIKNNAIRSDFKQFYTYRTGEIHEIAETPDMERRIALEKVDEVLRRLPWFDRTVFELYLSGQNMKEMCLESKIPKSTVYHTLHKVRETLKQIIQ